MQQSRRFYVLFSVLLYLLQAEGADKYTDENRPYEFGFTIDGEQHRHEKKDENGLIMGEFGFITADGVYHVTVYATDENGNFKILSMKNIRVKPYPTSSAVAPPTRKGNSLTFSPSQQASGSQEISPQQQQQQPVSLEPPRKSCSHCSLPTTSTQLPQLTNNQQYPEVPSVSQNYPQAFGVSQNDPAGLTNSKYPLENDGQQQNFEIQQNYPENQQNYKQGSDFNGQSTPQRFGAQPENPHQEIGAQTYPQSGNTAEQNYPQQSNEAIQNYPQQNNEAIPNYPQQSNEAIQNYPQQSNEAMQNYPQQGIDAAQNYPQQGGDNTEQNLPSGERNPKQYNQVPQQQFGIPTQVQTPQSGSNGAGFGILPDEQFPAKPTLISAQMQIVDKNTDINHLSPGEKQGLPNGLTKNDMMQLLYTFNYTVGFHGHHEEGYTNGAKVGYYYVTARNGVRTRIDYVADEKGFRPKITQEVLDLLSDEVPKPETEKDEKYGLKGYEFKWLYYPVGSKRR